MSMAWVAPFDPFEGLYHPNRNQGPDDVKASLSNHFHNIYQAWKILSDTEKRRRCIELLDLYDLHEIITASAADLLEEEDHLGTSTKRGKRRGARDLREQDGGKIERSAEFVRRGRTTHATSKTLHEDSHGESSTLVEDSHADSTTLVEDSHFSGEDDDGDDQDAGLPRIARLKKGALFDGPFKAPGGLADITEDSDLGEDHPQQAGKPRPRVPQLRNRGLARKNNDGTGPISTLERQKQFDKLRRTELAAFNQYRDAMVEKFEAEETAESFKDEFERAKWQREYFERIPRDTSQRMRLIRLFNTATKAFSAQSRTVRQRNRSNLSSGESFENNQFLGLPSRTKSTRFHRGYSASIISGDISGDQTSSDENDNSSDKTTSPNRSPRASSPRPNYHRREWSMPELPLVTTKRLPDHDLDPISPITGPGPKVLVRQPTLLTEVSNTPDLEIVRGSRPLKSPSPTRPAHNPETFLMLRSRSATDVLGSGQARKSQHMGAESRFAFTTGSGSGAQLLSAEHDQFRIKQIKQVRIQTILTDHVHELVLSEKQRLLGAELDADMDPAELLHRLSRLDRSVATVFTIKTNIISTFRFRLIYGRRDVVKQQHHTYVALSYRRKLHVEKKDRHFSLPLEPEMFQAVWDERLSDNEGVWIDQICIDGESEDEKTVSMSAMDMVYRGARLVIVALDDVELEAHEGAILEGHMDEFNHQHHVPASKRFVRRQKPYLESHDGLYVVIRKLMRSSWFRRAWCRHEMRLAREHIFLVPCQSTGSRPGKSVLRFTGKCLTHFLALATEVPFEHSIEAVKPALWSFFRDRSKFDTPEHNLRSHHGNFTTVVAEVFAMEAGGDPRIPEQQRAADARKDKISIILNTMQCGLALARRIRSPSIILPEHECNYMLLLLALAARDPGALCSVGQPLRELPYDLSSSWLLEPTNVDSGLNNYRTLTRLPDSFQVVTQCHGGEQFVQLDLAFLRAVKILRPSVSSEFSETIEIARYFVDVCNRRNLGRNRKRYLLADKTMNALFGSMRDVYVETLACILECGPNWLSEVCQHYGVSRWKHDLVSAYQLLIALKNTCGRWPESAWSPQAAGFIMDVVNFLVIRGMPRRLVHQREEWRPVCVTTDKGGQFITFVPPGEIRVAIPAALLDPDYLHLARLWVLAPRGERSEIRSPHYSEWTLLGKSVLFSDDFASEMLEVENGQIRSGQKVFGKPRSSSLNPSKVGSEPSLRSLPFINLSTSDLAGNRTRSVPNGKPQIGLEEIGTSSHAGEDTDFLLSQTPFPDSRGQQVNKLIGQVDIDNIDALLDPHTHLSRLNNLEREAVENCQLQKNFPHSQAVDGIILKSESTSTSEERINACRNILSGVMATIATMHKDGFCGRSVKILVEDGQRKNVVRITDIATDDIQRLADAIQPDSSFNNVSLIASMLDSFGVPPLPSWTQDNSEVYNGALNARLSLLCLLLSLAVVSYTRSHCSNLGQGIWGSNIRMIKLQDDYTLSWSSHAFKRQALACLNNFVGGEVWVFGIGEDASPETQTPSKAQLSTTIEQFADLWGPLYAVPSKDEAGSLLALHTEGGILFRTEVPQSLHQAKDGEVPMHWIRASPVRKRRVKPGVLSERLIVPSHGEESFPKDLQAFPSSAQLLIGLPSSAASSATTMTSGSQGDRMADLPATNEGAHGLKPNAHCVLDMKSFGKTHHSHIRAIGTHNEYYAPDAYQVNFGGGQYVNIGFQKGWKRHPATTYKTRLLEFCAKPHTSSSRILQILQLRVGLEVSACTGNARRTSLQDTLKLAYPSRADSQLVEDACTKGNQDAVVALLGELEATGITHRKECSLFWPLSDGMAESYNLDHVTEAWLDLLKDTPATACFGVLSQRCLTYRAWDKISTKLIQKYCSKRSGRSFSRPLFETAINLDSQSTATLPLAVRARLRLAEGFLEIANEEYAQLAFYERNSLMNRMEELAIVNRDGRKGHQHHELVDEKRASTIVTVCIAES